MELQALCSILPISQIPSLPSCISTLASLMPLEEIFGLVHPSITHPEPVVEDKRTWRAHQVKEKVTTTEKGKDEEASSWTAMDVMTAHALRKGWVTAKAGRPDVNRAGNASTFGPVHATWLRTHSFLQITVYDLVLRTVAENRVRWAFWPPDVFPKQTRTKGIWILEAQSGVPEDQQTPYEDSEDDFDSEEGSESDDDTKGKRSLVEQDIDEVTEGEEEDEPTVKTSSRFGLLAVGSGEDESEEEVEGGDNSEIPSSDASEH